MRIGRVNILRFDENRRDLTGIRAVVMIHRKEGWMRQQETVHLLELAVLAVAPCDRNPHVMLERELLIPS